MGVYSTTFSTAPIICTDHVDHWICVFYLFQICSVERANNIVNSKVVDKCPNNTCLDFLVTTMLLDVPTCLLGDHFKCFVVKWLFVLGCAINIIMIVTNSKAMKFQSRASCNHLTFYFQPTRNLGPK